MADVTITGLDGIQAMLASLPQRLVQGSLRAGMRQAANVIKNQAKANFNTGDGPNDLTGALKASIRVTQSAAVLIALCSTSLPAR